MKRGPPKSTRTYTLFPYTTRVRYRTLSLSGAAWFMGRHPHKHMILGFYNQDFANENGAITREIMQTSGYKAAFPGTTFQKGSKSKDNLITTRGGRMAFIGRGGSDTGQPAALVIIATPDRTSVVAGQNGIV